MEPIMAVWAGKLPHFGIRDLPMGMKTHTCAGYSFGGTIDAADIGPYVQEAIDQVQSAFS